MDSKLFFLIVIGIIIGILLIPFENPFNSDQIINDEQIQQQYHQNNTDKNNYKLFPDLKSPTFQQEAQAFNKEYKLNQQVANVFQKISSLKNIKLEQYIASISKKKITKQSSKMDSDFCQKSDAMKLTNSTLFEKLSFVVDQKQSEYLNPLKKYGKKQSQFFNSTNMIFTVSSNFHSYFNINSQIICQFQIYNHIPGTVNLFDQDLRSILFQQYQRVNFKDEQCLNKLNFYPVDFRLHEKKSCKSFFQLSKQPYFQLYSKNQDQNINENENQEQNDYNFLMIQGRYSNQVQYLTEEAFQNLQEIYLNGEYCNKIGSASSYYENNENIEQLETESKTLTKNINSMVLVKQFNKKNPVQLWQLQDQNKQYLIRVHVLLASSKPLIGYTHNRIDIIQCNQALFQSCKVHPESEIIISEFMDFNIRRNFFKKAKQVISISLDAVQSKLFEDPRYFEFMAFDFIFYEDFSIQLQNIQSIKKPHKYHSYSKIMEDGIQIMKLMFQQRSLQLQELAIRVKQIFENDEEADVNEVYYKFKEDYFNINRNQPVNSQNIELNGFILLNIGC